MSTFKLPPKARPKEEIKADHFNQLRAAIQMVALVPGVGYFFNRSQGGTSLEIRQRGGSDSAVAACALGQLYNPNDGNSTKAVRGGAVSIGDRNLNVPYYDVDTSTDGQWLIEVSISGVSFNTDDDDSLILPGIETASGSPTWNAISYTGSEDYTDNTNPSTPTGTGTAVLPIGLLTVASGKATFSPTGCGSFVVTQCAGVMTHERTGP